MELVRPARRFFPTLSLCFIASLALASCASRPQTVPETAPTTSTVTATTEPSSVKSEDLSPQEQIQKLREKITDLETRISALNEKINLEQGANPENRDEIAVDNRGALDPKIPTSKIPTVHVRPAPAASAVVPATQAFVRDDILDRYREAKIQFEAGRYTDATVEFASFVKELPDHALAPAAQYYVGMGYLKQSEYGRAEEELNRGLLNYPHSNFVPDTLLALLDVAQAQKKPSRVTYFQQKLLGTFPNSPQAVRAALKSKSVETPISQDTEPKLISRPEAPQAPLAPEPPKGDSP